MGKADRVKTRSWKNFKRTFHGNRFKIKTEEEQEQIHTPPKTTDTPDTNTASTSVRNNIFCFRIRGKKCYNHVSKITGYRFVNVEIL